MIRQSTETTHGNADLSASCDSSWVFRCWQDMQQRAARGEAIRAEAYLTGTESVEIAVDVIYSEYILRKQYEEVTPQEFLDRFPLYHEPLRRQFLLDGVLPDPYATAIETTDSSKPAANNSLLPPRFGKYTLVAKLASGGQADVYRAVHPELNQEVVIKVAATGYQEARHRQQLLLEGRILAELEHPHIARVYDVGFSDGRPFIVSRYVRGRTLEEFARQERLAPHDIASMVANIASGLAAAHRRGIVHLDVKPRNIVVDEFGRPCLIDFGLAVTTGAFDQTNLEPGSLRGTLAFMAPEQARGEAEKIGHLCDVFGLGAVLYFLVTSSPPFAADEFSKMLEVVQKGQWQRERLNQVRMPAALRRTLVKALDPLPENRFRNCEEFANALDRFARRRLVARRSVIATVAIMPLAIACGIGMKAWNSNGNSVLPHAPSEAVHPPRLKIEVTRGQRFFDLTEMAPLETGDRIRIRSKIPARLHVTLLLLTSEGVVKELCTNEPSNVETTLHFPPLAWQTVPLVGPPGTEVVFLIGRRDKPFTLADIRQLCGDLGRFPELPPLAVLTADESEVYLQQTDRDLGAPEAEPAAHEVACRQLEHIRQLLARHVDFLHAVAFCHVE